MSTPLLRSLFAVVGALWLGCTHADSFHEPFDTGRDPSGGRCLILTTNDAEANFDGHRGTRGTVAVEGTISRIAAAKKRLAVMRPGAVLLVSAGDDLQGRYLERADGDRVRAVRDIWKIYERAGFDYGTLGNHEFDGGPEVVRAGLEALSTYRILVSNLAIPGSILDRPGAPLLGEETVVTCGGLKIGLFGLLTPSARTISDVGELRFKHPDDPIYPAARASVAKLRALGAEIVVALSHLGLERDRALANRVPGIDAIVGGHTHSRLYRWERAGDTFIVQGGDRFKFLGYLELAGKPGKAGLDMAHSSWRMRPVSPSMPQDLAIEALVADTRAALVPERVVGTRTVPWDVTGGDKGDYGVRAARAIAHYARDKAGKRVDAALLSASGLRSATVYPPGPVTNVDIAAIHPFRDHLVLVEIAGADLMQAFDGSCPASIHDKHKPRAILSGLSYTCDPTRPGIRYRLVDGKPTGIAQPGQRVTGIRIGGKPIDPAATYTIVTLEYIAGGGSGFYVLSQRRRSCLDGKPFTGKARCDGTPSLVEVIEHAVRDGSMDAPLTP